MIGGHSRAAAILALISLTAGALTATTARAAAPYGDALVTVAGIDLQTATIPELQAAMASGQLTSRQLTQAYIDRINYFDHGCIKVNAIRTLTDSPLVQADAADAARAAGRGGPILGIRSS